ncbi:MAG TPA: acyloxyacyl hydrolase [Roseiarcus sp.]|nr:acyloxyacyl hydrolase [Roseiarcus sp.]
MTKRAATTGFALLAFLTPVAAADLAPSTATPALPPAPVFLGWEVRGGVYDHDPLSPERGSVDINGEILAPKLWEGTDPFWSMFIPHPDLGATVNTAGKTSNLYGGAAWNFDITQRFFLSSDFGLGVNDGKTGANVPPHWNEIGCNWWFHESESVGYRLTDAWSVMGTVEHSSNAGFCKQNRGLTNFGVRLGYRF